MDRRIKYSKTALRDALFALLEKKEMGEISISELCRTADINRNTFYNHYNYPLEIMHEFEEEVFEKLLSAQAKSQNIEDVITLSCQILEDDKQMSKIIFTKADGVGILSRILKNFGNHFEIHKEIELAPEAKPLVELAYQFGEKGSIAIIKKWVEDDFLYSSEQISQMIIYLVNKINKL